MKLEDIRKQYEQSDIGGRLELEHDLFMKMLAVAEHARAMMERNPDCLEFVEWRKMHDFIAALEAE